MCILFYSQNEQAKEKCDCSWLKFNVLDFEVKLWLYFILEW